MKLAVLFFSVFILACGPATDANNFRRAENSNVSRSEIGSKSDVGDPELAKIIEEIARDANGRVGVHAEMIDGEGSVSLNADERFAMQSVVKVPIAMAVLNQGKHKLDEKILVTKDELVPDRMHSPFRDRNPNGGESTVQELIELAVKVSDGTAADVLQRVAGGADGVQSFIESLNIDAMKVKFTHKEFSNNPERQYENWATPRAAVALLKELHEYPEENGSGLVAPPKILSSEDVKLLRRLMTETPTGPNRLKGQLPKDAVVIHKTGTSGTVDGKTAATNDIGLIQLPDGRYFAIAVFVGDSTADEQTREAVIARIAKAVWDSWKE